MASSSGSSRIDSSNTDKWKSIVKTLSSEHLNEGERPVITSTSNCMRNFIPDYLRKKFNYEIEPHVCTIKVICLLNDRRPRYTLTLCWYEQTTTTQTNQTIPSTISDFSSCPAPTQSAAAAISDGSRKVKKVSQEISVELGSGAPHEDTRKCDGPCGQLRAVRELRVQGRCEHAICSLCTVNAPMIENADGTMGCCNTDCFAADLAALCPDPKLRHKYFQMIINQKNIDEIMATYNEQGRRKHDNVQRALQELMSSEGSSSQSSSSRRGLKEMIDVCVMILESGPCGTICRRRMTNEVGSTETLANVVNWIVAKRTRPEQYRVFLNRGNELTHSELLEINVKRHARSKIRNFPLTLGRLTLVIDFTNIIRSGPNSPYI